jgi:hypothetical protein
MTLGYASFRAKYNNPESILYDHAQKHARAIT